MLLKCCFLKTVDVIEDENHNKIDVGYQPFLMEGLVSVDAQSTDQVKVTMLRDTGAMQTIVTKDAFPFSDQTFCGSYVLVCGIGMKTVRVSLASDSFAVKLYTGMIKVGVRESVPVCGGKIYPG